MSEVYTIIYIAIAVALITAFIVLVISKIGLREYIILTSKSAFVSKLFSCDFCLCFWFSVLISVSLVVMGLDLRFLAVPCLSTPLARLLV